MARGEFQAILLVHFIGAVILFEVAQISTNSRETDLEATRTDTIHTN